MGIFDKAKDMAGKAKDKVDGVVEANSDKIPDKIGGAYDKVSGAAGKLIPGSDDAESTDADESSESTDGTD